MCCWKVLGLAKLSNSSSILWERISFINYTKQSTLSLPGSVTEGLSHASLYLTVSRERLTRSRNTMYKDTWRRKGENKGQNLSCGGSLRTLTIENLPSIKCGGTVSCKTLSSSALFVVKLPGDRKSLGGEASHDFSKDLHMVSHCRLKRTYLEIV